MRWLSLSAPQSCRQVLTNSPNGKFFRTGQHLDSTHFSAKDSSLRYLLSRAFETVLCTSCETTLYSPVYTQSVCSWPPCT